MTANAQYRHTRKDIDALVKMLTNALEDMDKRQKASPEDYGFAGSAQKVRADLVCAVAFVINREPSEIETLIIR